MEERLSILVLDYARPQEAELCLKSIKNGCSVNHEVIYLCNGGQNQDYAYEFYKAGLVDKLLINKDNNGGGFGTVQLIGNSFSKYILWIECDCELGYWLDEKVLGYFIRLLNSGYACVDLTGGISGQNIYSGRSFFMYREFYNSIKKDNDGIFHGPGKYSNGPYLEQFIQEYFKTNNLKVAHINFVVDNGYSSVRENPDGSRWMHKPDSKQLKLISGPIKERFSYPRLSEQEWEYVLENQTWPDWKIPENEVKDSFFHFNHKF